MTELWKSLNFVTYYVFYEYWSSIILPCGTIHYLSFIIYNSIISLFTISCSPYLSSLLCELSCGNPFLFRLLASLLLLDQHLLTICWIFVGYLLNICWILLDICWIFVGYLLNICWISTVLRIWMIFVGFDYKPIFVWHIYLK